MKHKLIAASLLILTIPLMLAMGSPQGRNPEKIPIPAKKFMAVFIDQMDVVTECRDASIEGETFLEGRRGSGTNAISFANIQEVSFLLRNESLVGIIKLREGTTFELTLNKNQVAYGNTKYGTFQIKLGDLKKMTLGKSS
jgi:hypothetical protein